jgi:3-methylcrotonyl-CoA carboxylase alpha subunit
MIRRLMIANRGEIACRIARTARAMGIATVAVHSDPDAGAAHVAACDMAVRLPGALAVETYLSIPLMIAAARAAGADAVHPGYGFLSENADFAAAVRAAGLVFVGPSEAAMRVMGRKDAAKAAMAAAGVPVLPGAAGQEDAAALAAAAARIGFPVAIKAVAGGGGRGLRRVGSAAAFPAALAEVRAEALGAFGDAAVMVERWIDRPRHLEVQVLGDGVRALALGVRDCSLQRRHQKVLEETPPPLLPPATVAVLEQAAVRAAEAVGYAGAGTVEFVGAAGDDGTVAPDAVWFLEMNTRLQVEHPVTEAVTGLDLVEWQVRLAAGEALPPPPAVSGHAVEVRLYAEDPAAGFRPATGRILHLRWPGGLRIDAGVREGDVVSPYYDPMLAKLIAHGPDRAAALDRLAEGLAAVEIAGVATNLGFLARLVAHGAVRAGLVDTGLVGREIAALAPLGPGPGAQAAALVWAAGLAEGPLAGFALWRPLAHPVAVEIGGQAVAGTVAVAGPGQVVEIGGAGVVPDPAARVVAGHLVEPGLGGWPLARPDPLARAAAAAVSGDAVAAPLAGVLRSLAVAAGAAVAAGQALAVVEAMKMQFTLTAPRDGVVAALPVAVGTQVAAGVVLVRLEPLP